ncbi:sensor histidine kinase [Nonlabens tegetincola]|uniref:tetratricopeptide repeat-containing sensor histidine kinase n=1 Tax=Nonlabens tegetincola TaxID=323273 RepID=UPI0030C7BFD1
MKRLLYLFIILLLTSTGVTTAQQSNPTKLDSLLQLAAAKPNDSLAIIHLHKQFFVYVYREPQIAKALADTTINRTAQPPHDYLHAQSLMRKGIYYDVISKTDSALQLYNQVLKIASVNKDTVSLAGAYNNIGLVKWNRTELEAAMQDFIQSSTLFKQLGNTYGLASAQNNIGLILYDLGRYDEALEYHKSSLKSRIQRQDSYGIGASYSNIATAFSKLNQPDSVRYYTYKAIDAKLKSGDKRGLAIAYQNLAIDYRRKNVLDSALHYSIKADEMYKASGFKRLSSNNLQVLAELYFLDKQYKKGLATINESIALQDSADYKNTAEAYKIKARIEAGLKDYRASARSYAQVLQARDSFDYERRSDQAQDYFEKYKTAEKEQEITLQRAVIAENQLKIQKQNQMLYLSIAALFILGLIGFVIYRQQQLKNHQLKKEKELELALAKIETQNKLQTQRLRISRDLHDNIGSQLTYIISTIDNLAYALKNTQPIIQDKLSGLGTFTRSTIAELRDTIWAMNLNDISLDKINERIHAVVVNFNSLEEHEPVITTQLVNDTSVTFTSEMGMHVFRIIQEALNNAVKYAHTAIEIHSVIEQDQLIFTIKDHGPGFQVETVSSGNGISNMKHRASKIGATFTIDTQVETGTVITLRIPLHIALDQTA